MFLSILLFPEWIIVPAFGIGFVYGIYLVAKAFNFKRAGNLLEVDGTLTQFNSTRLNFIAVINRYEYEYYVDGNKFQGKESELKRPYLETVKPCQRVRRNLRFGHRNTVNISQNHRGGKQSQALSKTH